MTNPPFFVKTWSKNVFPVFDPKELYEDDGDHTLCKKVTLSYLNMGLVGEAAELFTAVEEGADRKTVILESGDVLWYVLVLAQRWGLDPYSFGDLERLFTYCMPLERRNPLKYAQNVLILASKLAEKCKKSFRDNSEHKDFEVLHLITTNLHSLLEHYGSDMAECMAMNTDKLISRLERGVIGGNGDYR
jgi:NTP pyrophosphatase (non-canonical NTP hydrolase)